MAGQAQLGAVQNFHTAGLLCALMLDSLQTPSTDDAPAVEASPRVELHPAKESRIAQYYGIMLVAFTLWVVLYFLGKRNEVQVRGAQSLIAGRHACFVGFRNYIVVNVK